MYAPSSSVAKNLSRRRPGVALGDAAPTGGASVYSDGTRAAFLAWVNAVKQAGGRATIYPYHGFLTNPLSWWDVFSDHDTYGCPAARYPATVAARFDNEPDQLESTPTGDYAWYLAPAGVIRWARSSDGMLDLQQMADAGTDTSKLPDDDWYKKLTGGLKLAAIGGVAILALAVLSYVPHPRDWE